MKKIITGLMLVITMAYMSSCATILGGKISECQKTTPRAGDSKRKVNVGWLLTDIIFAAPIALLVDFSTGAIYHNCTYSVPIETGSIKDNFTIKFLDKNIELVPNVFFNVKDQHLIENSCDAGHLVPGGFQSSGVTYKITIVHNNKTYYGRIGFYKVADECKGEGVASFYRIAIPEKSFIDANEGSQSCWGEFTIGGGVKRPTWIIWLSDVQIF